MNKKVKNTRRIQNILKIFILILVTYYAVLHQFKGVLGAPPIHAFCPFGGLESLFKLLVSGAYIKKIFPATMVLFIATIVMALVLRRGFCGWICPLGLLQEFFTRLGRKFKIKQNKIPVKADKFLKYVKHAGLLAIIFFTWKTGELVFAPYDPWAAYGHITAGFGELYDEFLIGTVFLILGLVGSIWIPQNWCKYFCPMGSFLALVSWFSPTKIVRNEAECIRCNKCSKICPVSILVSEVKSVTSPECYQCGDCIVKCPVPNTLEYKTFNKKIPWLAYGIISVTIFFGSVYLTKAIKIWKAGPDSIHEILVNEKGDIDPANIRGSMTLKQVGDKFNVPLSVLKQELNLPDNVKTDVFIKNIMRKYNFDMEDVRHAVRKFNEKNIIDIPLN